MRSRAAAATDRRDAPGAAHRRRARSSTTSASVGREPVPGSRERNAEGLLRAGGRWRCFRAKELGTQTASPSTARRSTRPAAQAFFDSSSRCAAPVEAGDLLLMYQPQVALHSFESTAVEALLRWAAKSDGPHRQAPPSFIQVAEEDRPHPRSDRLDIAYRGCDPPRGGARQAGTAPAWRSNVLGTAVLRERFSSSTLARTLESDRAAGERARAGDHRDGLFRPGPATVASLRQLRCAGRGDRAR